MDVVTDVRSFFLSYYQACSFTSIFSLSVYVPLIFTGEIVVKRCNVSKRSTYLESNGCATLTPIEMGTCDGSCGTYSM